jgi:HSP20 family protein
VGIRPPVDVSETSEAFVAKIDLPGVHAGDIEVSVSASRVTIKGKRSLAAVEDEGAASALKNILRERPTGAFSRTLTLPDGVDTDQITARLEQGVLTLTMPKHAAPPVEIEIEPAPGPTEE